jgi:thioredoxin reductase
MHITIKMGSIQELPFTQAPNTTRVLVIGGAYAGLAASLNLLDLCAGRIARFSTDPDAKPAPPLPIEIRIVDERDGYCKLRSMNFSQSTNSTDGNPLDHLISSPLALASGEFMPKAWVKFDDVPALRTSNISHIHGTVAGVDCERKVAMISDSNTGKQYEESYDYLIAASGLRREWPAVPQSLRREEYLKEAGDHIEEVRKAKEGVVVIGGGMCCQNLDVVEILTDMAGAVGIEMAAELKVVEPTQKVTLIHSRDKLLSSEPLPDDFKDRTLSVLQEAGVEVILNDRVVEVAPVKTPNGAPLYDLTLKDGSNMMTSHVIWAISHCLPSTTYLPAALLDAENYVNIVSTCVAFSTLIHIPCNPTNNTKSQL